MRSKHCLPAKEENFPGLTCSFLGTGAAHGACMRERRGAEAATGELPSRSLKRRLQRRARG